MDGLQRNARGLEERAQRGLGKIRDVFFPKEAVVAGTDKLRAVWHLEDEVAAGLHQGAYRTQEGRRLVRMLENVAHDEQVGQAMLCREPRGARLVDRALDRFEAGARIAQVEVAGHV